MPCKNKTPTSANIQAEVCRAHTAARSEFGSRNWILDWRGRDAREHMDITRFLGNWLGDYRNLQLHSNVALLDSSCRPSSTISLWLTLLVSLHSPWSLASSQSPSHKPPRAAGKQRPPGSLESKSIGCASLSESARTLLPPTLPRLPIAALRAIKLASKPTMMSRKTRWTRSSSTEIGQRT